MGGPLFSGAAGGLTTSREEVGTQRGGAQQAPGAVFGDTGHMTDGGWPADWDERMAGRDCPLCETLGPRDNDFMAAVGRLPHADVFLERRSAFAGYCVVVWHGPHVAEPADLTPDDAAGYWRDVVDVGRAVQARFE